MRSMLEEEKGGSIWQKQCSRIPVSRKVRRGAGHDHRPPQRGEPLAATTTVLPRLQPLLSDGSRITAPAADPKRPLLLGADAGGSPPCGRHGSSAPRPQPSSSRAYACGRASPLQLSLIVSRTYGSIHSTRWLTTGQAIAPLFFDGLNR